MNTSQARRLTERSIARNPSTITITRMMSTPKPGGGQQQTPVDVEPQTVRIFLSSMTAQDVVQEGGQLQIQRWGLLARWDADLQADDEFTHDGREFRVRSVLPVSRGGARTGYQADLEEVR